MGSLFIMISVPSAEHEKLLLVEKSLGVVSTNENPPATIVRPKKSTSSVFAEHRKTLQVSSENVISRSVSDDSVLDKVKETPDLKDRAQSATTMAKSNDRIPMEKRLEKCLKDLNIPNAVWVLGRAGKYYQVSFCTPAGEHCEHIIQLLNEHEIGVELNSTVSILPCSLYYEGKEHTLTPNKASPTKAPSTTSHVCLGGKELTAWERFVNSVRARLMVAQVVSGVRDNAVFTFDFLVLLIIASVTAAVGLVENSVVTLVASMLISPLMGPIMASTFGFVTKDWKLQKIGVLNELLGLLLCVLIGFLYGLIIGYFSWEVADVAWPTPEMLNRGDIRSLWVGALIALTSGAAVAIAVLGNYSGSLTGVAISASLMPPAVNAGLLWALAVVAIVLKDTNSQKLNALSSGDPVWELIILGALSLALTFINIVCIFLTGIFVLKIKEVTPRGSKDYSRLLWKETIKIARDYKYNLPKSAERIEQGSCANQFSSIFSHNPYRMIDHQYTWSAYGTMQDIKTVNELASAWHQLTLHPPTIQQLHQPKNQHHFKGSPFLHSNLARHFSAMSSPTTVYGACDDRNSTSSQNPEGKRFTVTPTNGDIIG